jgi:hypothetical protein
MKEQGEGTGGDRRGRDSVADGEETRKERGGRDRGTEWERTKEERGVAADAWETLEKGMEVRRRRDKGREGRRDRRRRET